MTLTMSAADAEALDAFVAQLRAERERRGWSQRYVAERAGVSGQSTIAGWELGMKKPIDKLLRAWAAALDVAVPDGVRGLTARPCGTNAGHARHVRRGERPCQPCAAARRDYERRRRS